MQNVIISIPLFQRRTTTLV